MRVHVLCLGALIFQAVALGFVSKVHLEQITPFPVTLGNRIHWLISPEDGDGYDSTGGFTIDLENKVIASWNLRCEPYGGILDPTASCEVKDSSKFDIFFIPNRGNYGQRILITFYPNKADLFNRLGQIMLNATIKLIQHPSYLDMSISLESAPDYVRHAPADLQLTPPTFLHGSMAKVECKTDGALPSQAISFAIVCDNPSRAAVEQERQDKAKIGHPYEISYGYYGFNSPPTDEELAERIAIGYGQSILAESVIARSSDNLTLSATLPINSKAHDCTIYCRLMDKVMDMHLTVFYPTTIAYMLPRLADGVMRVGSSLTCCADGHPEPKVSLHLRQPVDPKVTASDVGPKTTRLGLRPDEYTIRGSRFTLAYNATPGIESLLVCVAENALPNALDFLGFNKTIAVARFTVAAVSFSSIGIVAGICLVILICATFIILIMVYLKRGQKKQKKTSDALQTQTAVSDAVDTNGAARHRKKGSTSGPRKEVSGSKAVGELNANRFSNGDSSQRGLLSSPGLAVASTSAGRAKLGSRGRGVHVAVHSSSTLGRTNSTGTMRCDRLPGTSAAAASMNHLPQPCTPGNEDGVVQSGACAEQLVLTQEQKAIFGMHSNATSIYV